MHVSHVVFWYFVSLNVNLALWWACAKIFSNSYQNVVAIFQNSSPNYSQFFDACFACRILVFRFPRFESGALVGILFKYIRQNLLKFFSKCCHNILFCFQNYFQLFDACFACRILVFSFPRCESGALEGILFQYVHQNLPKILPKLFSVIRRVFRISYSAI